MEDKTIEINKEQFEALYRGLHIWNTICVANSTVEARNKFWGAHDLIEQIWGKERGKIMSDKVVTIGEEQFKILCDGLHVWNTFCMDSFTEAGRKRLIDAQDLIDKIWRDNKQREQG